MIAFVTLLLGLISGVYPIEVTVSGPVSAVEFTLDGAPAGRISGPPWIAKVDLGSDLRPRELVARALDSEGHELSRASQWVNVPRPTAEVGVVLANDEKGIPRTAQLTWQSVNGVRPTSISLTLDGEPLVVDPAGKATLPPRDLESLHVLSADLWFPPGITARRDVAYGGQYGTEVSTELTAVPVRMRSRKALPAPAELGGWFTADGRPLAVDAVENGPAKVILVRVPSGAEMFDKLVPASRRSEADSMRSWMRLDRDDRVRILSLGSSAFRGSKVPADLFSLSRELTAREGGLFSFLTGSRMLREPRQGSERIADAVAVAGLQAADENDRRAVVLVLGGESQDASRYDVATVRRYLAAIRVPLFVWSLYGAKTPAAVAWSGGEGKAEDVSSLSRLADAVDRLKGELADQRVVWLDGHHLPQSIALSPAATGLELVADKP
ncbi:MAG TPA: hypothetical protein VIE43_19115 [Thermoanaerobaculia bacterium]|nr:hypothetical protein [Thermoanaerobaculia bacterium]